MTIYEERCIALSAIFQVALLVNQLAQTDAPLPTEAFSSLIESLFVTSPNTTLEIYKNLNSLHMGNETLLTFFMKKNKTKEEQVLTRYVINLMLLQKKLKKNHPYELKIGDTLKQIQQEINHGTYTEQWILSDLSNLYSKTISKLGLQIRIIGKKTNLQQRLIVSKIRALLLAGIRAAVLWEQKGGKTHHLFIFRHPLIKASKQLKEKIIQIQ